MTGPARPSDLEVKEAVVLALAGSRDGDTTGIGVAVTDGVVTTSGQVASYPEKLRVERAVHRVHGVRGVAEEVTVAGPFETATDTSITLLAADALEAAVAVPGGSVEVGVHDGVVTLVGAVTSYAEREAAGAAMAGVPGVRDVRNLLRIRPDVGAVDIRAAIVKAMMRHAIVDGNACVVTADHLGGVTITGTVESWSQRREAEAVAWAARGVTSVSNRLHVRS